MIEIFGTGTGAVVCPVAGFEWNEKYYAIAPNNETLNTNFSRKVLTGTFIFLFFFHNSFVALEKIHYGEISHPWAVEVPLPKRE